MLQGIRTARLAAPRPGWPTRRNRQRLAHGMIISGLGTQIISLAPSTALATVALVASLAGILATAGVAVVQIVTGRGLVPDPAGSDPRAGTA
jgi:hypothetical protein